MSALQDVMTSFSSSHQVIQEGTREYVLYAGCGSSAAEGLTDFITLSVTDGISVLSCELGCGELETKTKSLGLKDTINLLNCIKRAVEEGNISLNYSEQKLSLFLHEEEKPVDLPLQLLAVPVEQERQHLKTLLFRLAKQVPNKGFHASGNDQNGGQKASSNSDFYCFNLSTKRPLQSKCKKCPGMSMINPGSKKIKAAKGIQFEDD